MPIRHVVVLMLENRSYDNILGALYAPSNLPPYNEAPAGQANLNGLTLSGPDQQSNPNGTGAGAPVIPVANQSTPTQFGTSGPAFPATTIPLVDPGEYFKDMAQQIVSLPYVPAHDNSQPYADYPPATPMQGFVNNYANLDGDFQTTPPPSNVADVMNYFTPAQLPVTSFLARNFAVCDTWFAAVPTQTYTNRAFALTAAPGVKSDGSYSFIDDGQYSGSLQSLPSVLQQLDDLPIPRPPGPMWKLYFHDFPIAAKTVPYVDAKLTAANNENVSTFDDADWGGQHPTGMKKVPPTFVEDVSKNALPPFSFIEPRYGHSTYPAPPNTLAPNSNHPGGVDSLHPVGQASVPGVPNPPIDVSSGELLLMRVYNLLRRSELWNETLLIVTYDEHGGLYDHVAPQAATPPGVSVPNGNAPIPSAEYPFGDNAAYHFDYSVFGARVPAIFVSPLIAPGTAVSVPAGQTPFDHSSIVRTVWDLFIEPVPATPASLTNRDAAAPSVVTYPGLLGETPTNPAGEFGGLILCNPGSLVFSGNASQTIVAGAAGLALTASFVQGGSEPAWLTLTQTFSDDLLTIIVTVDTSNLPTGSATYTATVFINGSGVANSPMPVPVTLTM
jgi:phospholipase C